MFWHSAEPDHVDDLLDFDLIFAGRLSLQGQRLNVGARLMPEERLELAAIVRSMRTVARGAGESFNKREFRLECGATVGVHATEGRVSIHVGYDPAELAVKYVALSPLDAGALVRALESL